MRGYCFFLLLLISMAGRSQKNIIAQRNWTETNIPCNDYLSADSLGYLYFISGCEAKVHVLINRYIIRGDTIKVMPFDFLAEEVFLDVIKIPSDSPVQQIALYGADGKPVVGSLDSTSLMRLISGKKDKLVDQTANNTLKIPRGQYRGVELLQLQKIFGVPIVFWLEKNYDYRVRINVPTEVLNNFILTCSNFREKFLLLQKNTISFRNQKLTLVQAAATTPSPSF